MQPINSKLTNEPGVIANIQASMAQLRQLAAQHHKNYLAQWDEYIMDAEAPAQPGPFTNLEEQKTQLAEEYERIRLGVIKQMSYYDAFCAQNNLDYSDNWNTLLEQLRPYLSGISALSTVLNKANNS